MQLLWMKITHFRSELVTLIFQDRGFRVFIHLFIFVSKIFFSACHLRSMLFWTVSFSFRLQIRIPTSACFWSVLDDEFQVNQVWLELVFCSIIYYKWQDFGFRRLLFLTTMSCVYFIIHVFFFSPCVVWKHTLGCLTI